MIAARNPAFLSYDEIRDWEERFGTPAPGRTRTTAMSAEMIGIVEEAIAAAQMDIDPAAAEVDPRTTRRTLLAMGFHPAFEARVDAAAAYGTLREETVVQLRP